MQSSAIAILIVFVLILICLLPETRARFARMLPWVVILGGIFVVASLSGGASGYLGGAMQTDNDVDDDFDSDSDSDSDSEDEISFDIDDLDDEIIGGKEGPGLAAFIVKKEI